MMKQRVSIYLERQYHEIFDFRFFSWISFPQAPENLIRVVLIFFKNSWRYSQLNFVWTPSGSRVKINFSFKFALRCKQSDIVPIIFHQCHNLPPVSSDGNLPLMSLTTAENLLLVSLTPEEKFSIGINNTSSTSGKICRWCREVRGVGKVANEKYEPWWSMFLLLIWLPFWKMMLMMLPPLQHHCISGTVLLASIALVQT